MKFECGDLERALAASELMPEAIEHLKTCGPCRREYRLWNEISFSAKSLHQEWESPALWPKIRKALDAERKPSVSWWKEWKIWTVAAAAVFTVVASLWFKYAPAALITMRQAPPASVTPVTQDFLTEQALLEVEKNEAAYRESIEKLSRLAKPKLANTDSAAIVNVKEKLLLLDSAIDETRNDAAVNRFNTQLQTTLAGLYREKQQTLEELLTRDQKY